MKPNNFWRLQFPRKRRQINLKTNTATDCKTKLLCRSNQYFIILNKDFDQHNKRGFLGNSNCYCLMWLCVQPELFLPSLYHVIFLCVPYGWLFITDLVNIFRVLLLIWHEFILRHFDARQRTRTQLYGEDFYARKKKLECNLNGSSGE